MDRISFKSTFIIPTKQPSVKVAQRAEFIDFVKTLPNSRLSSGKKGIDAKVSIPNADDNDFLARVKSYGYKFFKKMPGENITKDKLEKHIKEQNKLGKVETFKEIKIEEPKREDLATVLKRKFAKELETLEKLKAEDKDFKDMTKEYGEDFTTLMYLGRDKFDALKNAGII